MVTDITTVLSSFSDGHNVKFSFVVNMILLLVMVLLTEDQGKSLGIN